MVVNPGKIEDGSRNAVVAAEKLSGKSQKDGVSQWSGRVSVTSHKGVEPLGDFVCQEWPDHVAKYASTRDMLAGCRYRHAQ